MLCCVVSVSSCFRLKRKLACKIRDEHYPVKDMAPPSEAVAKMAAKTSLTGKRDGERDVGEGVVFVLMG